MTTARSIDAFHLVVSLLSGVLLGCNSNPKPTEIQILSVDYGIETPLAVPCDSLLSFLPDHLRKQRIAKPAAVKDFEFELHRLKKIEMRIMDARALVVMVFPERTDTLCADQFSVKVHDEYYEMSPSMRDLIWRMSEAHEP